MTVASPPSRVRALPRDRYGRPVPWFVDDQPTGTRNHRTPSSAKRIAALRDGLCWVCGQKLPTGTKTRKQNNPVPVTFAVTPTAVINRLAADPPCHEACATYAVTACPFMLRPDAGGMVLWSTTEFTIERPAFGMGGSVLLRMHDPVAAGVRPGVTWWVEARMATGTEAYNLLADAYARLQDETQYDPDPVSAAAVLRQQLNEAARHLPPLQ